MSDDIDRVILEDLEATKRGERPPFTGEIQFTIDGEPLISTQSKAKRKAYFSLVIQNAISHHKYYLLKDVTIEIIWYVHRSSRYETSSSPDLDNTIKPILDSLCGVSGILIDDCQVHQFCVTWRDVSYRTSSNNHNKIEVIIHFHPDDWAPKSQFCFVKHGDLCFPFENNPEAIVAYRELLDKLKDGLSKGKNIGMNDFHSSLLYPGPGQHAFHFRRVENKGFIIL